MTVRLTHWRGSLRRAAFVALVAALPPLPLAADEALAVSIALGSTAARGVSGIDEAALRALVKLEQVLPTRLRRRADALRATIVPRRQAAGGVTSMKSGPSVTVAPSLRSSVAIAAMRSVSFTRQLAIPVSVVVPSA